MQWEPSHTKMELLLDPRVKGKKVTPTSAEILKLERKKKAD